MERREVGSASPHRKARSTPPADASKSAEAQATTTHSKLIDGLKWGQSEAHDSFVGLVANAAATTGGGSRSADFSPTPFTTSNQQFHNLVAALDCYSVAMTRSVPMRLAALLSLMLLAPATVFGHEAKVTAKGM